jgi:pimeloyl-ACP methyl ester carboxylesterase
MAFVEREGVRLFYEESGTGEPPLVLIHGWCCDHTYLEPQREHFRSRARALAVDLRGHGQSDKPEQEYSIPAFADDVAWLCEKVGLERAVVVGHSMGGLIAVEIASRFPALARGVVLLDSPIVPPEGARGGLGEAAAALRGPGARKAQREFVAASLFIPEDDPARKARILDAMAATPEHVMASAFESIASWDGAAAVRRCRVPILSVAAAAPLPDLKRLRELAATLVTAQTAGAGHFHQLEVPDQVNAMIERFVAAYAR